MTSIQNVEKINRLNLLSSCDVKAMELDLNLIYFYTLLYFQSLGHNMRPKLLILLFFFLIPVSAQWQNSFNSEPFAYEKLSGWVNFTKSSDKWIKKMYSLDSLRFQVMNDGSSTPQFTYNFSAAERLAGMQLYSTGYDLNGNNTMDFYVLGNYGTSPYRQSIKVFDISTGAVLFEKNDNNYYYTYPQFADIDNDGIIECYIQRYDYPSFATFRNEVYKTGVAGNADGSEPSSFQLMQNYPNPFNPSTVIEYSLESESAVSLKIYTVQGEFVKELVDGVQASGSHRITWDGSNYRNDRLPSGVYMYRLNTGNQTDTRKMLLVR